MHDSRVRATAYHACREVRYGKRISSAPAGPTLLDRRPRRLLRSAFAAWRPPSSGRILSGWDAPRHPDAPAVTATFATRVRERSLPASMTVVRYQLPNGLRVVLQENRAAKVVAFQAWVGVGSADEPPELAGIAHVLRAHAVQGHRAPRRRADRARGRGRRRRDQRLDLVRPDRLPPRPGLALLRHRARYPGRRPAEFLVRSRASWSAS